MIGPSFNRGQCHHRALAARGISCRRNTDHHVTEDGLALVPVKTLRFAPTTPHGVASVLTGSSIEPQSRLLRDGPGAYGPQGSGNNCFRWRARMQDFNDIDDDTEQERLARCRELLGHEAAGLSDEQLSAILQHAHAMANVWSNYS